MTDINSILFFLFAGKQQSNDMRFNDVVKDSMPMRKNVLYCRQIQQERSRNVAKNLILYYSRRGQNYVNGEIRTLERGNSELCAQYIRDAVGGDLFEVRTVREYPEDYMRCTEEAKAELRARARPELREYLADVDEYDNVFVCGPCWWGTYPMAIYAQLERLDLTGKKVLLLMTHEGSGLGGVQREMKKLRRGAAFGRALAVHGTDAPHSEAIVAEWARSQV